MADPLRPATPPRPNYAVRLGSFFAESVLLVGSMLLLLGKAIISFFVWPFRLALTYLAERHTPAPPPHQWLDGDDAVFDLWNERTDVQLDPNSLRQTVIQLSGRGNQSDAIPSLSRLVDLALTQKTLAAEIERRRITPDRLRQRVFREATEELQAIEREIETLKTARLNIHKAFEPAYKAAYDAITQPFDASGNHRFCSNVLVTVTLVTTASVVAATTMALLSVCGIISVSVAPGMLLLYAGAGYAANAIFAVIAWLGRGSLREQHLRFLEQLNKRLHKERADAQPAVEEYRKKRSDVLQAARRLLIPWMLVRARRSPRLRTGGMQGDALPGKAKQSHADVHFNLMDVAPRVSSPRPANPPEQMPPRSVPPLAAAPRGDVSPRADKRRFAFLCHAKEDKKRVVEIYKALEAQSLDPWMDVKKLIGGQDWWSEIEAAIEASITFVFCLTRTSAEKVGVVQSELHKALSVATRQPQGAIFIIPARLEECEIPPQLAKWHCVDLYEHDGIEQLCQAVRTARIAADDRYWRIGAE